MELNEICNKVCKEIKEGWKIEIHLENGAGWCEIINPNGSGAEFNSADMSIEEQIEALLRALKGLPV